MKTLILTFFGMMITFFAYAQKVDTIINLNFIKVHFDTTLKQGIYFEHSYFPADFKCKRNSAFYEAEYTLKNIDFYKTGFDRGHIFPASYIADSCELARETNVFYNIVPQWANFNRGTWAKIENQIRKRKVKDSVMIQVYGIDYVKHENFYYPSQMIKVVTYSPCERYYYIFTNREKSNEYQLFRNPDKLKCEHPKARNLVFF